MLFLNDGQFMIIPRKQVYWFTFCLLVVILPHSTQLAAQCLTNVDFNNWNQAGDPSNGNWNVMGGGSQLHQQVNG